MPPTVERTQLSFETKVFEKQRINLGGTEEDVVKGGRDLFTLLPKAFEGIEKIGVCMFLACWRVLYGGGVVCGCFWRSRYAPTCCTYMKEKNPSNIMSTLGIYVTSILKRKARHHMA